MNSSNPYERISQELSIKAIQVQSVIQLLQEGATVPFIARYRKEQTGSLDEVQIRNIQSRYEYLEQVEKRRSSILKALAELGINNPELIHQINHADLLSRLEDLYLPYKPKKKTRASLAREKGLQALADEILLQKQPVEAVWESFKNSATGLIEQEEALKGASDILAEQFSERPDLRDWMRVAYLQKGYIQSTVIRGMESTGSKFSDYFEWKESIAECPSHRMLAMRRGEQENILILEFLIDSEDALHKMESSIIEKNSPNRDFLKSVIKDSYERLLQPGIETEVRSMSKQKADEQAIKVFAENLKSLLLAPPMGAKRVLALDPGFKSGCKLVVLGNEGQLLEDTVIYPHEPLFKTIESEQTLLALAARHEIQAIAIGNGTASRETEAFVRSIALLPKSIPVIVVSESGASIYSASDIAREEFPNKDLTVRGAVSIGRRLCDPLSELVKIDPKSIGVGQYQHDVDAQKLKKALDEVVESCVNAVGVELNTASASLLSYVSGIGPSLAQQIISYRRVHGPFLNRESLKSIPRMGQKTYEQCAGFLRLQNSPEVLDRSGVHPERYVLVAQMAEDCGCSVEALIKSTELRKKINLNKYVGKEIGLPTLMDILKELEKPGRDPRKSFEVFSFDERVKKPEDLSPGMVLPGIVTNVTRFGAFVDIGVHQDGLVHVSQLSDQYVDDAMNEVKVGEILKVRVVDVDLARKRIGLSLKGIHENSAKPALASKKERVPSTDLNSALEALKSKFKSK